MRSVRCAAVAIFVLATTPALSSVCGTPPEWKALSAESKSAFQAALDLGAELPKVGAPFNLTFKVCSADNLPVDRLSIDAAMPAHKHGMNYQPQLNKTADGHYEATGFLFHMPGLWQVTLSIFSKGKPNHLTVDLDIP